MRSDFMPFIKVDKFIDFMVYYHVNHPNDNEVQNIEIFKTWVKKNNVTHYYQGATQWGKLETKKKFIEHLDITPREDHPELFKTKNNMMILVCQPYLSFEDIESLKLPDWVKERGLKFEVSEALSWHYPGRTILIQYTLDDKEVFEAYLKAARERERRRQW